MNKKDEVINCLNCGQETKKYNKRYDKRKFCCLNCANVYNSLRRLKTKCSSCGKEITNCNFKQHFNSCGKQKINDKLKEEWQQPNGTYKCPHCGKEYTKKGIYIHIWRKHTEEGKKFNPNIGYVKGVRKGINKFTKAKKLGLPKPIIKEESRKKWSEKATGRKHSNKTKEKISKIRKQYLKENPDKVPYLLNHYTNGESYPETYFRKIFEKYDIQYEQEKREGLYSLDFVVGVFDIEIDGNQHYLDERIIESDKRRTKYLESIGYKIIRIRWSEFQKKNYYYRHKFINELIDKLIYSRGAIG